MIECRRVGSKPSIVEFNVNGCKLYAGPCEGLKKLLERGLEVEEAIVLEGRWCSDIAELVEAKCLPVRNYTAEPRSNVDKAISEVIRMLEECKPVAVCCSGGCGRSGMVASAAITARLCLDPEEVMLTYTRCYLGAGYSGIACPETEVQKEVVVDWFRRSCPPRYH